MRKLSATGMHAYMWEICVLFTCLRLLMPSSGGGLQGAHRSVCHPGALQIARSRDVVANIMGDGPFVIFVGQHDAFQVFPETISTSMLRAAGTERMIRGSRLTKQRESAVWTRATPPLFPNRLPRVWWMFIAFLAHPEDTALRVRRPMR